LDNIIVVIAVVLAALVGAAVGGYVALKPTADKIDVAVSSALEAVKQDAHQAAEALANLKVEVPQPKVTVSASISPWSAFWIFLATVAGIVGARLWSKSRIGKHIEFRLVNGRKSIRRVKTTKKVGGKA
jgi:ABC-type branched-subunit amino acid transport system permease subunit